MKSKIIILLFTAASLSSVAYAGNEFTVKISAIHDQKAVFATIESKNVVPARTRIGGTIADLSVREGDHVERGQIIATVGDEKIALQINSVDSQIAGYAAQATQSKAELDRLKQLVPLGAAAPTAKEKAQRDYDIALNAKKSAMAQKDVLRKQISEGQVLAPVSGRILNIPVTAGTVVLQGETLATIAEEHYILRLQVPERHARYIKAGDAVRLDQPELGDKAAPTGKITLVYPQIDNGRVIADADVENLGNYFVGQRVRVWVSGGDRSVIIVPKSYVYTKFGIDYVRVKTIERVSDVPVQRGQATVDGIEILSGLKDGDILVQP